mgnify:CR=1 FL=1|jgi:hypothetical protein
MAFEAQRSGIIVLSEILGKVCWFVETQGIANFLYALAAMHQQPFGFKHYPLVDHLFRCFS